MAVREFNGTTDRLVTNVGAASGMTYGTWAAIVKFTDLSDFRGIAYAHDSGGSYKGAFGTTNFSKFSLNDGTNDTNLGSVTLTTGVWYLVVARKAAGASVTPRFSVYNFTSSTWTHGAGTVALNDFVAPGTGGTHQFAYQGGTASVFAGRVAMRAHWSNTLPWTADAAGDTAIQSAGLHTAANNWTSASPTALHLFNQASETTPVSDQSSAGTANQVSISGTTVITGDDPPGFTFLVTSSVTATRATTWNVGAMVSASRATTWNATAAVSATRATTWNVAQASVPVSATRTTTWNVLPPPAPVTATRSTTWGVGGPVTALRSTTWVVGNNDSPSGFTVKFPTYRVPLGTVPPLNRQWMDAPKALVKYNNEWLEVVVPYNELLLNAQKFYLGGYEYVLTFAEVADLPPQYVEPIS